jgi:2-hydroxy-6-oxonona-2,4-dienedioate hydrolase
MVWHGWGQGRPLVLLHGGSGSWTHWIRTIPYFMHSRHVLAADLPGLGDSPDPPQPHSADGLAQIVASALEQLVPAQTEIDVVGFSFGGIIAGHFAAMNDSPVRKVVIVGSPPFGLGSTGPSSEVRAVDPALDFEQAKELHRFNLELFMLADARGVDALSMRVHHDNLCRSRLRSRKIARAGTLQQALPRIRGQLYGIWGDADVTAYPDLQSIRDLFSACKGQFDVLAGVGHWAAYEAAGEFNELLEQRLREDRPEVSTKG